MIIFVEGIDKSGKDTIVRYINEYTKYVHYVSARGPMSVIAYGSKFGRDVDAFEYLAKIADDVLIIHLVVDEDDFNTRCKLTNEPYINFKFDSKLFEDAEVYCTNDLGLTVATVNTSHHTPKQIARLVADTVRSLKGRKNEKHKHKKD